MRRATGRLVVSTVLTASPLASVWTQTPDAYAAARPLDREEAASPKGAVAAINGVRAVRDGAVFVNDRANRRVVMLDHSLRIVKVVLDASRSANVAAKEAGPLGDRHAPTALASAAATSATW